MSFLNTVIWITGASSGIGKALAIEFSQQNVKLIVSSRKKADLELVKNACKFPSNVEILVLDLEDHTSLQGKTAEAMALFGGVDILINNGGISQRSFALDTDIAVDKRMMDVNYIGTVALTKAVLPYFIEKKRGHFVITTSIVGKIGTPLRSSYAASKHALHGFFDSLRAEVHKDHIHVTLVCPGFVSTNISFNALTGDGSPQQKIDAATQNGIDPARFAKLMVKAIQNKKEEVYIGGFKERLAVVVKRFFPKVLSKMIRKLSVT
ncbi:SDR family oxidoreductase [Polaribacter sp. HL-MS24]|uniref:SDR family oxidoreductase n=1 Tax=Polaribacter sp. HL-MS24 TaxID=3077735 RepID=UPI0029351036|nr:SDR family oxidoreductase [Polaribacter sp. HL-MS24]WOC41093.1 SDR family oxidoreductase [Polaribacter sp. HL-MS24]